MLKPLSEITRDDLLALGFRDFGKSGMIYSKDNYEVEAFLSDGTVESISVPAFYGYERDSKDLHIKTLLQLRHWLRLTFGEEAFPLLYQTIDMKLPADMQRKVQNSLRWRKGKINPV